MNVAKWLPFALLALPVAELGVLIAVIVAWGLLWTLVLQSASSFLGLMVVRYGGGTHVSRVRTAIDQADITALSADGRGTLSLLAGILLLIPGFITDLIGLALLVGTIFRDPPAQPTTDGIIDLPREQWHQVEEPRLDKDREDERKA
jgi:UPF0716 protein FxsA